MCFLFVFVSVLFFVVVFVFFFSFWSLFLFLFVFVFVFCLFLLFTFCCPDESRRLNSTKNYSVEITSLNIKSIYVVVCLHFVVLLNCCLPSYWGAFEHPCILCIIFFQIDVLSEIIEAVRGTGVEIYVDGGVRMGTDVLKALALGARAVFVGRPIIWGLAHDVSSCSKLLNEPLIRLLVFLIKCIGCFLSPIWQYFNNFRMILSAKKITEGTTTQRKT